ncbi:MAG: 5-formyltetrahydrofolate cyclo-ligase [Candidatus Cryptobacteroides sp.]
MCSETSVSDAKRAIRARIRAVRESSGRLDPSPIVRSILELGEWQRASTVLLYHPLPGEVDLRELLEVPGKRLALPLVAGGDLLVKEYVPGTLVSGYAGILEPPASAADVPLSEISFAIVPGVAFDSGCRRLGRGRGFYDRLLKSLDCPVAGVAYSWQMVETVPADPWDIRLDMVLTDSGNYFAR